VIENKMTVELKELLLKKSSIIIWGIIGLVYFISCESEGGDKIVTPEETEEQEDVPSFNASDWIIYR